MKSLIQARKEKRQELYAYNNHYTTTRNQIIPGVGLVSSLELWLDAASGVVLDTSGRVQTWYDRSGKGNTMNTSTPQTRPYLVKDAPNLLRFTENFADSYWSGYWTKPVSTTSIADPFGGNRATQMAGTDFNPPSNNASGIIANAGITQGLTYTVACWLRSTSGTQNHAFGLNDAHNTTVTLTTTWQKFIFTATNTLSGAASRGFQIFEGGQGNPAWEIAFPQLLQGSFNASTIPPYAPNYFGQNQATLPNGLPTIKFKRAENDQMQGQGGILHLLNQPASVTTIVVMRPDEIPSVTPNQRMINFSTPVGAVTKYSIRPNSTSKIELTKRPQGGSPVALASTGSFSTSTFKVITVVDSATNPERIRIDGVADTSSEIAQNYDAGVSAQFHIGSFAGFADGYEGEIAEILMFREELNSTTLSAIESYLMSKYGLI